MEQNSKANNHDLRKVLKTQILEIRDSGLTNMLDANAVQRLAHERDFHELVCLIEDHRDRYSKFIFSGDESLLTEP